MISWRNTNISFVLLLFACSCIAQSTRYGNIPPPYEEDLSAVRLNVVLEPPKEAVQHPSSIYTPIPQETTLQGNPNMVNEPVNEVLDSIAILNKRIRHINGYTIQIYSGQNRREALTVKSKIVTDMEDEEREIVLQYNQPNFSVTTGQYFNRLEAQKDLLEIKKLFPKAIFLPKKILLQ